MGLDVGRIEKTRGFEDLDVRWTVKTRGFVGPDDLWNFGPGHSVSSSAADKFLVRYPYACPIYPCISLYGSPFFSGAEL